MNNAFVFWHCRMENLCEIHKMDGLQVLDMYVLRDLAEECKDRGRKSQRIFSHIDTCMWNKWASVLCTMSHIYIGTKHHPSMLEIEENTQKVLKTCPSKNGNWENEHKDNRKHTSKSESDSLTSKRTIDRVMQTRNASTLMPLNDPKIPTKI